MASGGQECGSVQLGCTKSSHSPGTVDQTHNGGASTTSQASGEDRHGHTVMIRCGVGAANRGAPLRKSRPPRPQMDMVSLAWRVQGSPRWRLIQPEILSRGWTGDLGMGEQKNEGGQEAGRESQAEGTASAGHGVGRELSKFEEQKGHCICLPGLISMQWVAENPNMRLSLGAGNVGAPPFLRRLQGRILPHSLRAW